MQQYINKLYILILLALPLIGYGQSAKEVLNLTDRQYQLYNNGQLNISIDPKKAIAYFDTLLTEKENLCPVITFLGLAYQHDRDIYNAKRYFKKGISCDSTKALSYNMLSNIYQEEEEFDSAELMLLKWIEYQTKDNYSLKNTYFTLGQIARSKNEYHKSIEYLTEAINRCYDGNEYDYCYNFYYLRADSYSIIEEPEKALEDILVHAKLNPEDRATLVLKGEILQQLERFEESNAVLMEYLLNPTNQGENWVNYMIGYNYNRLKEFGKSCLHLKEAERLGYEHEVLDEMLKDCE